jgi:hypothetical protein
MSEEIVGRYVRVKHLNRYGVANGTMEILGTTYYHVAMNGGSTTMVTADELEVLY